MGDSPQLDDNNQSVAARLAAIERRIAALESNMAMPAERSPTASPPFQPPDLLQPPPASLAAPPVLEVVYPTRPIHSPTAPIFPPPSKNSRTPLDLEAMIGQNWASWIGGIVLLLGISFFLKYAWDQGWIRPSPLARVLASLLLGLLIAACGEWVWRKRMRGLAGTLHGTAIAVVIAAFFGANLYFAPPVFSRNVAFAGVAVAAACGILLALRIDVMTVAILSCVGAYISPAVLSSGQDKSLTLLVYLLILAAAQWILSFLRGALPDHQGNRFRWLSLRWVALLGSFIWFAAWWAGFGERNGHQLLAQVWLALIYCGFLTEVFATLQVALVALLPEQSKPDSVASLLQKPPGPAGADVALAIFSLWNTAATFGAFYVVFRAEPHAAAVVAIALAAVQACIAIFTRSRAMMWSALLQSAGLITCAAPLWFDQFSITIAWLLLAAAIGIIGWQFNLESARGWAIALLLLSTARLLVFDSFDPMLRVQIGAILNQTITRWLALAWCVAILYHFVAWMKPRPGGWPIVDHWLAHTRDAKCGFLSDFSISKPVLDYATAPARAVATTVPPDRVGATVASLGTILFLAVSAFHWRDLPLDLLALLWLAPIVLLAPAGRSIQYATHAACLTTTVAVHWAIAGNYLPMLTAWDHPSRDIMFPIANLSALASLLLIAAIFILLRQFRATDQSDPHLADQRVIAQGATAIGIVLLASLSFESLHAVDLAANRGPAISDPAMAKQMALSVLWSLSGFASVLVGFWKKIRPLRLAALVLLGVTLAKIFLVDMKNVDAVWRILSFMALGSLLLAVSYLYHRHLSRPDSATIDLDDQTA